MNRYFVWFKILAFDDQDKKSKVSASIHNYLLDHGKKITTKSNAFFVKSTLSKEELTDKIVMTAEENIELFITDVISGYYQGWMKRSKWDFIEK